MLEKQKGTLVQGDQNHKKNQGNESNSGTSSRKKGGGKEREGQQHESKEPTSGKSTNKNANRPKGQGNFIN